MKVGFLGICDFGVAYLKMLVEKGEDVQFASSKKFSSKHIDECCLEIQRICKENTIEYLGAIDANTAEMQECVKSVDVVVLGGYDEILKKGFISNVKNGVYNTHLGLIPKHRGCYPVIWSILCDDVAGFTTYKVDERIDIGEIVHQGKIDILKNESAFELYERLSKEVINAFPQTWDKIKKGQFFDGDIDTMSDIYHKQGMPNDRFISWYWSGHFISRFMRSLWFPPYPSARSRHNDVDYEFEFLDFIAEKHSYEPGNVVYMDSERLKVACNDGYVECNVRNGIDGLRGGIVLSSIEGEIHKINKDYSHNRLIF